MRLTKTRYAKEPLRRLKTKEPQFQCPIFGDWSEPEQLKFTVSRPTLEPPNLKEETAIKVKILLEPAIMIATASAEKQIKFKYNHPLLRLEREALTVSCGSLRVPKLPRLDVKRILTFPARRTHLSITPPKLEYRKLHIISNLALFRDCQLCKCLEEFCVIYEREDEFDFAIIQASPEASLAILKPSSIVANLPKWITHCVLLCIDGGVPNRQLLEVLYSYSIKIFFLTSLDLLRRILMTLSDNRVNLTEMETAHERLLTKGLGMSNFQAQHLLSLKPLPSVLQTYINSNL
jgi:hypothetical protein